MIIVTIASVITPVVTAIVPVITASASATIVPVITASTTIITAAAADISAIVTAGPFRRLPQGCFADRRRHHRHCPGHAVANFS